MASFGEELRQQRELRQITLQEIAEATKVNVRFLEALERDDFQVLPGGLFNRGFIRAYASHVGLDPEATVNAYLYEINQGETAEALRGSAGGAARLQRSAPAEIPRVPRVVILAAGAVLLAALLLWLLV